jgi:hypothetical protein
MEGVAKKFKRKFGKNIQMLFLVGITGLLLRVITGGWVAV